MDLDWSENPEKKLCIAGKSIEYACFGPKPSEAFTMVLLHHGLGCLSSWRDFPRILSERTGFGIFVYSRAGYGYSDSVKIPRPLDYMTSEAMESLPLILNHIGIERGVLLGHSDGATISAIYTGSVIDYRIRGVVLMAPHFFTEQFGLNSIAGMKSEYENGELKAKLANWHSDPDCTFYGWYNSWMNSEFKSWNVAEVIEYIRVPVLAIQGRDDQFGTFAQIDELDRRIYAPLDIELLENCRHMPHVEKPKQTLAAIVEFTGRLEQIDSENVSIPPLSEVMTGIN